MAQCGICLDTPQNLVSIPCGHVHCEQCLRGHINSGTDALKSSCPICRKPFHIAAPDLAFVPQKYHDFILPSVRKIYLDTSFVADMKAEIDRLTQHLRAFTKENEDLLERCADHELELDNMVLERRVIKKQEEEAQREMTELRKKYDSLKKKYQSRDDSCSATLFRSLGRRSSLIFENSRDILPKAEEHSVSLQDLDPNSPRPKRALPRSHLSSNMRQKDESPLQLVKRQRTHRFSDVGSSNQVLDATLEDEDENEDEDE